MKILRSLVLFILACTVSACDDFGRSKSQPEDPAMTVGVLISNTTRNAFFKMAFEAFQGQAAANPRISLLTHDAQDNAEGQIATAGDMIRRGAQALIINMVDAKRSDEIIALARKANIPVIFFNRSPSQKALLSYDRALFVDGDAVQGGVMQGQAVLKAWKNNPAWDKNRDGVIQFAMLSGIPGNPSAIARTTWSINTMRNYPQQGMPVQQVASKEAYFRSDTASEAVEEWLGSAIGAQIEVILANNDAMAIGALQAAEKHGVRLPVFGIDAIPEARALLQQGKLAGTVLNDASTQAKVCIQSAVNLSQGRPADYGMDYRAEYQVILVPYQLL